MTQTGKNVQMYRERLGLSRQQLAALVHYSDASMITQIELGTKSPSLEKAQDLAIQLGVSLSALVGEPAALHSVTNHASGDHTVIQNIEGHYCAVQHAELGTLVQQCVAAGLAQVEARLLAALRDLLRPSAAGTGLAVPEGSAS